MAYGHFWSWAEEDYDWAHELHSTLGGAARTLEGSFALNLLARDPHLRNSGLGRTTLQTWLAGIAGYSCWLQTSDVDSPARRLYERLGFFALGHGPQAPNGQPGLVMFRPPI
ncbi:MAG: GNAT family N-acetyltransferase [Brevibacterium sp.]|nr:GNAT family N-acetyltransferase [Brevibacterium sp.]